MDARARSPVILSLDASGLSADLATVDWLARLALQARRMGGGIELRSAPPELRDLIELAGLQAVLPDG